MISIPLKINTILLNIKINQPKLANMCGHKLAKSLGNVLSRSENTAKSFNGTAFF